MINHHHHYPPNNNNNNKTTTHTKQQQQTNKKQTPHNINKTKQTNDNNNNPPKKHRQQHQWTNKQKNNSIKERIKNTNKQKQKVIFKMWRPGSYPFAPSFQPQRLAQQQMSLDNRFHSVKHPAGTKSVRDSHLVPPTSGPCRPSHSPASTALMCNTAHTVSHSMTRWCK